MEPTYILNNGSLPWFHPVKVMPHEVHEVYRDDKICKQQVWAINNKNFEIVKLKNVMDDLEFT